MTDARDFSTRGQKGAVIRLGPLVIAASALVLALAAREAWTARSELRRAQAALDEARREHAKDAARLQELQSRRTAPGGALASAAFLTAEAPPPRVLSALAEVLPPDVRLDALSLTYGERVDLDMRVAARDAAAYDLFLSRLVASPLFADVVPGPETREGEVLGAVRLSYRPGAAP